MSADFIRETTHNQIAEKLRDAFFAYYRYRPSPGEVNSWKNSLRAMALIVQDAKLNDHGVILEYQLPLSSKRLDFMICGIDGDKRDQAVIVELKQWDTCERSDIDKLVISRVGGAKRELLHPSVQVGQYQQYLEDTHTAFHEGDSPIKLSSCAYLHNYSRAANDPLVDSKFAEVLTLYPLFDADGAGKLSQYLKSRMAYGAGAGILQRIEESRYKSSKKLMDHVAQTVKTRSPWILLDEQLVVFEHILATVDQAIFGKKKQLVLVKGGPGTGKSVLAINLLAQLVKRERNAHYATGSKAFTETLWDILGARSKAIFKYFNSYGVAEFNAIDVLICDEAHRIRQTSNSRFTPKEKRSSKAQLQELIDASKVAVFFIDDRQVVRPNEIGSSQYIRELASAKGYELSEYELTVQFRCAGSDGFVNWVNNTLQIERTANVLWDGANEVFDFRIFESPEALETEIRKKSSEGFTARVAAGFCWPWSDPNPDGTLPDDVVIGGFKRPWDAKPGAKKLAPGIPSASLWATDPNGINQIGCVYNIQGFELDYVGVIWGKDLVYSFDGQQWVGNKQESADQTVKRSKEQFADLVKNTYRVLLSRGLKGCYVYFMDKDTEHYVRTRIEGLVEPVVVSPQPSTGNVAPFKVLRRNEVVPYENAVPVFDLKVAAGYFAESESSAPQDVEWAELPDAFRIQQGLFIAQVVGESMNKRIPSGSWCLFRANPVGSRNGKIVLVQNRGIADPEHGGSYTLKRYRSEKADADDGTWHHTRIELVPESTDSRFKSIIFDQEKNGELKVVAEFVAVL